MTQAPPTLHIPPLQEVKGHGGRGRNLLIDAPVGKRKRKNLKHATSTQTHLPPAGVRDRKETSLQSVKITRFEQRRCWDPSKTHTLTNGAYIIPPYLPTCSCTHASSSQTIRKTLTKTTQSFKSTLSLGGKGGEGGAERMIYCKKTISGVHTLVATCMRLILHPSLSHDPQSSHKTNLM